MLSRERTSGPDAPSGRSRISMRKSAPSGLAAAKDATIFSGETGEELVPAEVGVERPILAVKEDHIDIRGIVQFLNRRACPFRSRRRLSAGGPTGGLVPPATRRKPRGCRAPRRGDLVSRLLHGRETRHIAERDPQHLTIFYAGAEPGNGGSKAGGTLFRQFAAPCGAARAHWRKSPAGQAKEGCRVADHLFR